MTFLKRLQAATEQNDSLLCVGLDPDPQKFPETFGQDPKQILAFNIAIVDATADLASSFKPNSAFYEAFGAQGIEQLKQTIEYIKQKYPDIPVILDAKRGDIGNTNDHYASYAFDCLGADALTVQPYLGVEAVEPFFKDPDKGVFVLARTSNPDSAVFQNVDVDGRPFYQQIIKTFLQNYDDNCFFVVGATYPDELAQVRALVGDDPVLVPGLGTQGGEAAKMVPVGVNAQGQGLLVNSSRGVLYASDGPDFAEAARSAAQEIRDQINQYRKGDGNG